MASVQISGVGSGQVTVAGELTRHTVPSLSGQADNIAKTGSNKGPIAVQLAQVTQVDTAGLAWLVALYRACQKQQLAVQIVEVPQGLIKLAKLSDVEWLFAL